MEGEGYLGLFEQSSLSNAVFTETTRTPLQQSKNLGPEGRAQRCGAVLTYLISQA